MVMLSRIKELALSATTHVRNLWGGGDKFMELHFLYAKHIELAKRTFASVPRRHKKGVREQLQILGLADLEFMTLEQLKQRLEELEQGEE